MKSDLFSSENMAQQATAPGMTLQNAKSIKYAVNGEMHARQGSMIAFRGNLQFERKGQGIGGMLKRAVTGEGLALMAVRGQGEAWFAHEAANCFIVDIEQGDVLTVNGRNVLCFDSDPLLRDQDREGRRHDRRRPLQQRLQRPRQARPDLRGQPHRHTRHRAGSRCTSTPTRWSAGAPSSATSLHRSQSVGSMVRGGSGEAVQLMLQGEGFVIVRPSELKPEKPSAN